jgi:hypothetical protein
MRIDYDNLRPMDAVCTASMSFAGASIRLGTAGLKKRNGLVEMWRLNVANHVGYIVEIGGLYWLAEMLNDGLKISSLKEYTKDPKKNRIVAVKRLAIFDDPEERQKANEFLIDKAHRLVPYDWHGSPGAFLGLCSDNPDSWYCSEMVETIANMYGGSWDAWQLNRSGKKSRIAPIEIQYGKNAIDVRGYLL